MITIKHFRRYAESGNRYKPVFVPSVNVDSGRMTLISSGRVDTYEVIQSHRDSVDIHVLISRFKNGETDVLNQRAGFYGDITDLPKTYAEMHDLIMRARNSFDALPVEVRRQYDFDFNVYLGSLGKIVKDDQPDVKPVTEPASKPVGGV